MSQLIQLPAAHTPRGQWVAADRVSSIEVQEREFAPPCVVVKTKDGARIVIDADDWNKAVALRDSIATQVNDALKAEKEEIHGRAGSI